MRRLGGLLALACAACGGSETLPTAGLGSPVALVAAPSTNPGAADGFVMMMTSSDDDELRAFLPGTELFARGPNAISPLSIPVGFRPERLAAGSTPDGLNYTVAAGAAARLTTVETAGFRVTKAAGDDATCAAGGVAASCLPGRAVDVAAGGNKAFAPFVPSTVGGAPGLVVFDAVSESGRPVLVTNVVLPLTGRPAGVDTTTDGTRVFVADLASPRVVEVTIPGGATRDIAAGGPVSDVFVVPSYSVGGATRPEAEFILALLADGTLQTLSPATGGPAADPITPAAPIAPLSFQTPVRSPIRDLAFVPCIAVAPCSVALQVTTSDSISSPLVAFVGLGDGRLVPIIPDPTQPQVFRPVELGSAALTVGDVTPVTDNDLELVVDPASLTEGVTLSEVITVTFSGVLPGFVQRQGTVAGTTLTDPLGNFIAGGVRVGDGVRFSGPNCSGESTISAVAVDTLVFVPPMVGTGTACLYELHAGGDGPWVVVGSQSGLIGRATTDVAFVNPGTRFFYPPSPTAGPAFAFTITGPNPANGFAFAFTTSSGFDPLSYAVEQSLGFGRPGLANAVAAIPNKVFATLLSTSELVSFQLDEAVLEAGQRRFR